MDQERPFLYTWRSTGIKNLVFYARCKPCGTATKYLEALVVGGFVSKQKVGRSNYYVNVALNRILLAQPKAA